MAESAGKWYGFGAGGPGEDLPEDVRQELLRRQAERRERRGRLLARVEVEVWENGEAVPRVSLPPEVVRSVEDSDQIADVVRIAREALADWR
jgi:hypothetical protein